MDPFGGFNLGDGWSVATPATSGITDRSPVTIGGMTFGKSGNSDMAEAVKWLALAGVGIAAFKFLGGKR